ncbi:MAG: hypothetical protein QF834_07110, partial [Candidatus Thalassarchaeaceae archaeon]|nr:hypothetical protein [Candidatus Thalassarchaeaceae archaeon]
WGRNTYGRLGDNTTTDRHEPTPTASLGAGRTAVAISAGGAHTCAILDDGSVACWGDNDYGELGDGTTTDRHTPTQTASLGVGRTASVLEPEVTLVWAESPDEMQSGNNQLRFDFSSIDLMDDTTYYFHARVDGDGSQSQSFSTYYNVGNPSYYGYSDYDSYHGEDIYLNFTVYDWTCASRAYANLNYISPNGGHYTYARMPTTYFDNADCDSAGHLDLSRATDVDDDGTIEWEHELSDTSWEISAGTTDLFWSMSDLEIGERYQLYFYVYVDGQLYYQSAGAKWFAEAESEMWHFPLTIDEYSCNVYGYGYLRLDTGGNSFDDIDSASFHPQEPCVPPFDVSYDDSAGNWADATVDVLPSGTTQMLLDFSSMNEGEYYLGYHWNTESGSEGWNYEYVTVDGTSPDGLLWNLTLDSTDCFVDLDVNLYDYSHGYEDHIGNYNDITLQGPCILPFALETEQADGTYDFAASDSLSIGTNQMRWDLSNLQVGSEYRLDYYWHSVSHSTTWFYEDFTHDGSDIYWQMELSVWDCNAHVRGYLYNDSNNGNQEFNDYYDFYPDDCQDGGDVNLQINKSYGWADANSNSNPADGANEMSWGLSDLEAGYEYTLEWLIFRNSDYTSYDYAQWDATSDEDFVNFTLEVEQQTTCDIRFESRLYVDTGAADLLHLESRSFYLYPSCSQSVDFNIIPVEVLQTDGTWQEDASMENGNQTIRVNLSGLESGLLYYVIGEVCTVDECVSYSEYDFDPANLSSIDVNISVDDWTCEVRVYVHSHLYAVSGANHHILGYNEYIQSPCTDPGDVDLEVDGDATNYGLGLDNGTNDMVWNLTDLASDLTYTLDWYVEYNNDIVQYNTETWFTGTDDTALFNWTIDVDESVTCNVEVHYRVFIDRSDDDSGDWVQMDDDNYYDSLSCNEWVYPDDHYVSIHADINGTWEEDPDELPFGENDLQLRFENLTMGADYRVYFYHSGTGFDSHSEYTYFTYDGTPINETIDIAPWACDIYYDWNVYLYDFRYPDSGYNSWHLGSDSGSIDGPCQSMSYNSTQDEGLNLSYDEDTQFNETNNTIVLEASNLQADFPYYMESRVYFDGNLNLLEWTSWFGDNQTNESLSFDFDIPGFVCDVDVYSRMYVWTTSGNTQIASIDTHDMDGPCDDTDGDSRRTFPLYAQIDGSWALVDDDTPIQSGETQMYWDLGSLGDDEEVYFYFNGHGASAYGNQIVTADDHPLEFTWTMSEFSCSPEMYSYLDLRSPWTGSYGTGSTYIYIEFECLDGGDIALDIQDDEGNWNTYEYQSYDLMPGTTNFSWALDGLLDGYEYEFYWYQDGSDGNQPHYEYFTADSTGTNSFDFDLTIDEFECNVYYYAYLRPMSQHSDDGYYDTDAFSFHPEEPCYPPFDVLATDSSGNYTVDALHPDFVLSPGQNHLFFDFGDMGN